MSSLELSEGAMIMLIVTGMWLMMVLTALWAERRRKG